MPTATDAETGPEGPRGAAEPDADAALVLSDVSDTGLLTAFCHALESRTERPLLSDPEAERIMDRLTPVLARSPKRLHRRMAAGKVREDLRVHVALRARQYDRYAKAVASAHPGACVVNLGCGLDTRFWRIDDGALQLYDLDLPEVIAVKRRLVKPHERYHLLASSVLEHGWMDVLAREHEGPFVFLAEGLLMYLPAEGVRGLVKELRRRFPGSQLVAEVVNSSWLRPSRKWMIDLKMRKQLGLGEGATFRFGVRDGKEIEEWSDGIRLVDEWFYLDEDEEKLGALRWFREWRMFRETQWTVRYVLG